MLRITGDKVKITFCTNESIAEAVFSDYSDRGFDPVITTPKNERFVLDLGGPLVTGELPVFIDYFGFFPRQIDFVLRALDREARPGGYVKVHGYSSCICMPAEDALRITAAIEGNYNFYCGLAQQLSNN